MNVYELQELVEQLIEDGYGTAPVYVDIDIDYREVMDHCTGYQGVMLYLEEQNEDTNL